MSIRVTKTGIEALTLVPNAISSQFRVTKIGLNVLSSVLFFATTTAATFRETKIGVNVLTTQGAKSTFRCTKIGVNVLSSVPYYF